LDSEESPIRLAEGHPDFLPLTHCQQSAVQAISQYDELRESRAPAGEGQAEKINPRSRTGAVTSSSPEPILNNPLKPDQRVFLKRLPTPAVQEHDCSAAQTCSVYSVACHDSNGIHAEVFSFETDAFCWLAQNAEGPDEATRVELLELALTRDDAAFWHLLEQSNQGVATYHIQSHDLQLQPNLF
jgi:hypothetical protein